MIKLITNIILFFILIASYAGCTHKKSEEKATVKTQKDGINEFLSTKVNWALSLREEVDSILYQKKELPYNIEDSLCLSSLNCKIWFTHSTLCRECLSFVVIEDQQHIFYPLKNIPDLVQKNEIVDLNANPFHQNYLKQNSNFQQIQDFLNNNPSISISNITEQAIDKLFIISNYGKAGMDRNLISGTKKIKNAADLKIIEQLYFDVRLSDASERKLPISNSEISNYKKTKRQLFQFLETFLTGIKYGSNIYEKVESKNFIYFDNFFIHVIEIDFTEKPRFKDERFKIRYTVY